MKAVLVTSTTPAMSMQYSTIELTAHLNVIYKSLYINLYQIKKKLINLIGKT